jgi:hypothetical protein
MSKAASVKACVNCITHGTLMSSTYQVKDIGFREPQQGGNLALNKRNLNVLR